MEFPGRNLPEGDRLLRVLNVRTRFNILYTLHACFVGGGCLLSRITEKNVSLLHLSKNRLFVGP